MINKWQEAIESIAIILGPEMLTEEHPPIENPETVVRAVQRAIKIKNGVNRIIKAQRAKITILESRLALLHSKNEEAKQCPDLIEDMERDLFNAGWTCYSLTMGLWKRPDGTVIRGRHRAWHVMTGIPMEAR